MKSISAIVVDDEKDARDYLTSLINDHAGDVEIIASTGSATEAVRLILEKCPQIVFLDIEMPGNNGFEVVKQIRNHRSNAVIIFVTAYDQYTIDAIRCAAFDYLLKPIDLNDFQSCMQRYRSSDRGKNLDDKINRLLDNLKHEKEKICFSTRTRRLFLDPTEIIYIEADRTSSELHCTNNRVITASHSLKEMEQLLPASQFLRINRSQIINKHHLTEIVHNTRKCTLKFNNEQHDLSISRRYHQKLLHN